MTEGYAVPGEFGAGKTYAELVAALDRLKEDSPWKHKVIVLPPDWKSVSEEDDDDGDAGSLVPA